MVWLLCLINIFDPHSKQSHLSALYDYDRLYFVSDI